MKAIHQLLIEKVSTIAPLILTVIISGRQELQQHQDKPQKFRIESYQFSQSWIVLKIPMQGRASNFYSRIPTTFSLLQRKCQLITSLESLLQILKWPGIANWRKPQLLSFTKRATKIQYGSSLSRPQNSRFRQWCKNTVKYHQADREVIDLSSLL